MESGEVDVEEALKPAVSSVSSFSSGGYMLEIGVTSLSVPLALLLAMVL